MQSRLELAGVSSSTADEIPDERMQRFRTQGHGGAIITLMRSEARRSGTHPLAGRAPIASLASTANCVWNNAHAAAPREILEPGFYWYTPEPGHAVSVEVRELADGSLGVFFIGPEDYELVAELSGQFRRLEASGVRLAIRAFCTR